MAEVYYIQVDSSGSDDNHDLLERLRRYDNARPVHAFCSGSLIFELNENPEDFIGTATEMGLRPREVPAK